MMDQGTGFGIDGGGWMWLFWGLILIFRTWAWGYLNGCCALIIYVLRSTRVAVPPQMTFSAICRF